jgi:flagellar hook-basal body complex protein FliE
MSAAPLQAIGAILGTDAVQGAPETTRTAAMGGPGAFARMLEDGVEQVNQKLTHADTLVTRFALDDAVPLHEVTYALQDARLSLELMLQVRARLVDAYQQFAGMQL